ncbi:MAG: replicase [Corpardiv virus 2]|nr:MAG: replicase [Corpardiv virus 2]
MLLLNPQINMIVFTGDPAQNRFSPPPNCPNNDKMTNPLKLLSPFACEYLTTSHRLPTTLGNQLGLPATNDTGGVLKTGRLNHGPILVSTPGAVEVASHGGRSAYTPLTSQGTTLRQDYTLQLDNNMINSTDHSFYTALTRGTKNVYLCHSNNKMSQLSHACSRVCRALVTFSESKDDTELRAAIRDHIIRSTPAHLRDPLKLPGKTSLDINSLLYHPCKGGKVYSPDHPGASILDRIRTNLTGLYRTVLHYTWHPVKLTYSYIRMVSAIMNVPDLLYHVTATEHPYIPEDYLSPPSEPTLANIINDDYLPSVAHPYSIHSLVTDPDLASTFAELLLKNPRVYGREYNHHSQITQQVDTTDYATSIFLHHRRVDKATEQWTFSERHVPIRPTPLHYLGGGFALFNAFNRTYGMEYPPFDYHFFMVSEQETLSAMLDKGETALIKASAKNDPNTDPDKVSAFLKGQFISKLGTIYREAKKGQMITECHQYLNRLFGPTIRYIYNCVRSNLGPEILILKGMTDEDVEAWFATYWTFSDPYQKPTSGVINAETARQLKLNTYEDDYTGFDSTQNEEFLAFQCLIMDALQIPQYIIDLFAWHHTHLYSFLGEMNVMIPSGAMHTYDFNTLDSMAYFALKHRVTPHLPLSLRGDIITIANSVHPCDSPNLTAPAPGYTTTIALAFSGDDTLANEVIEVHPGFLQTTPQLFLTILGHTHHHPSFRRQASYPWWFFLRSHFAVSQIAVQNS